MCFTKWGQNTTLIYDIWMHTRPYQIDQIRTVFYSSVKSKSLFPLWTIMQNLKTVIPSFFFPFCRSGWNLQGNMSLHNGLSLSDTCKVIVVIVAGNFLKVFFKKNKRKWLFYFLPELGAICKSGYPFWGDEAWQLSE